MRQIEDNVLERSRKLVESRIGLCIRQADNESFHRTLNARMKSLNIDEPAGYLNFLESDTGESKREWKALVLLITTGESYFFRDKGIFFLLQNTILPELINKRRKRAFRIWSAGCSTGEEPYSIAILLDMLLPDLKGWDIVIFGTDINEESLKKAGRGIYSDWSFRMVDEDIKRKYFKRHKDDWEIDGKIKEMVTFQYGNLMEDNFFSQNPEICNMDIIICRNVFIYFKKETVSSVFNKFINTLNDEGYLITGHGELYGHDLTDLHQIMYPEAVIYKKTVELKVQTPENTRLMEGSIKKKGLKIREKPVAKRFLPFPDKSKIKPLDPKPEIEELIRKGRYAEAIDKAESFLKQNRENYDMYNFMAIAYANSGAYEKAESACREVITLNADSADPYFLLAHIAEIKGNDEEAKKLFRKAIYLNPAFIAAYCELGGLYEKEKDLARAKKVRSTAIELLTTLPAQAPVKPYDMTAEELLKYVEYLTGSRDDLAPTGPAEKGRR
ncbi:MAG: tetratricopeptide repeat protein [Nitrospirae bacterium]|nr:tetratricopeptide repeat protein [Nitrospirota bacterium]